MSTVAAASLTPPLAEEQLQRVGAAVAGLSPAQLQWVSGYVAGLGAASAVPAASQPETGKALTILYGSQTGNGEGVAKALSERASELGFATQLHSLADYRPSSLKMLPAWTSAANALIAARVSLISLPISAEGARSGAGNPAVVAGAPAAGSGLRRAGARRQQLRQFLPDGAGARCPARGTRRAPPGTWCRMRSRFRGGCYILE